MTGKKKKVTFSLKDHLFNQNRVEYLAGLFLAADDNFNASVFIREVMKELKSLELKQRIVHIASHLKNHLSSDYRVAAKQIVNALPSPLDPTKTDDDFGDFIFAPLGEFVVRNGSGKKHLKISLKTLKQITMRFSMEDAIRSFINQYPQETLKELEKWSTDKNYHVRRLVSEGTRPSLPWSGRLSIEQTVPLPMLETLHADRTRYVTRSVCNHLNDIAKKNPQTVIETLKRWKKKGEQDADELRWMSKHALRTLVKQANADALRFLGFKTNPKIKVTEFAIHTPEVKPGQAIEFSFTVTANGNESLLVDYIIDFVKANGSLSAKVHKIKQLDLKKGDSKIIKKRHPLRANATTYTLYPGTHHLTLQINGKAFGAQSFELL